jgi:hypothetical protein
MINPRYAAAVAALLAFALIPTVIHSYLRVTLDDGLKAAAIPATLAGATSVPTARRPGWIRNNFDTDDWTERTYKVDGLDVTMFAARSFDAKRLYHHPELAVLRGTQATPSGLARATARPDVPLHVLDTERDGRHGVAVYALLYDGRFIEDPIGFQLRTSAELLFTGRKALTLFMTSDLIGRRDEIDRAPATRVLLAAIAGFERQAAVVSSR